MKWLGKIYNYFDHKESIFLLIFGVVLCLFVMSFELYLLQRTEQFFGGGALNRPYSLHSPSMYVSFFFLALLSDIVFYGFCIAAGILWLRKTSMNYVGQHYLLVSITLVVILTVMSSRWQIYQYFSDRFDWGVLHELTGGNIFNMFGQIGAEYFIWVLFIPVALVLYLFILRQLNKHELDLIPWSPGRCSYIVGLSLFLISLGLHFFLLNSDNFRFGLKTKLSYWLVDEVLAKATDFDFDGFSPFTTHTDSDNFNSDVNPLAIDIPNNQIDENGLVGDLSLDFTYEALPVANNPSKNVVLIIVETFRTDVVGTKLDDQEIMPFLSSLARQYSYTDQHYSNYGVTARAIQTIMSGSLSYNEDSLFLIDYFNSNGYKTYVISAQDETWGDTEKITGMRQADFLYDTRSVDWSKRDISTWERVNTYSRKMPGTEVVSVAKKTLSNHNRSAPFFMYLNFQELHYPYFKPGHSLKFIDNGRSGPKFFLPENHVQIFRQYANGAYTLDLMLKELHDWLVEEELFDNTLIIIAGDHPDSLYENGVLGHAWTLDKYQRQTPLVVINGKGSYTIPIGQDELYEIIMNSVEQQPSTDNFSFVEDPQKEIFVISGNLEKPRRFGFLTERNLFQYDMVHNALELDDGSRISLDANISSETRDRVKQLINFWEFQRYLQSGSE